MRDERAGGRWGDGVLLGAVLLVLAGCNGLIGDAGGLGGGPSGRAGRPAELTAEAVPVSGARRLTRVELDNTLDALLGEDRRLAHAMLPEDDTSRPGLFLHWPFDNAYPRQESDRVYVEAFEAIAGDAAHAAVGNAEVIASILPCTPSGPADAACMRAFVTDFGRRAFRRPLEDAEIESFMTLQALGVEAGDFDFGVECVLTAMLQSPDFVYRVEIGTPDPRFAGVARLTGDEIATRMAYFLWGTTPDEELSRLADDGELADADRRREIALDMLDDPRARDQVDRFHAMWLGYSALPHPADLTQAMREETRALLDRVIFDERAPYLDIFTYEETYVGPELAERYGLDASGAGPAWVPYGDSGREGILSHGSVLSAFSKVGDTSPTRRGIFVRERLLCQELQPPPPTVNVDDVPDPPCRSDFVALHQSGGCGSCHSLMDPIGWGLEQYDMSGRYRTHDEGKPECPIDGEGDLAGIGTFSGPRELAELLVSDGRLEQCVVRQVVRFALGREERDDDEWLIASLTEPRAGTDWTFLDLLADVVASEAFVRTRPDPIVGGRMVTE